VIIEVGAGFSLRRHLDAFYNSRSWGTRERHVGGAGVRNKLATGSSADLR